jgi:hypothetical protein
MGGFKLAAAFHEDNKQGATGCVSSVHIYCPEAREISIFADSHFGSICCDRLHAYHDYPALLEGGRLVDQID